jgi:hypothetical protein
MCYVILPNTYRCVPGEPSLDRTLGHRWSRVRHARGRSALMLGSESVTTWVSPGIHNVLAGVHSLLGEKGPGVHDLGAIGVGLVSQRHELRREGFRLLPIAHQLGGAGGTGEGAEAVWHPLQ